jgi:carbamate kinase
MSDRPLAVVAVGGNALIRDRDHVSLRDQAEQAAATCGFIAELVADGWRVVVTHGNGPQVGFILHRSELAKQAAPEVPLVYAVADTQGALGFMFQQGLTNALVKQGLPGEAVAIVTRVVVDEHDASFDAPTKPIGALLDEPEARSLAERFGWSIMEDSGRGWRRAVASPVPQRIVELGAIEKLLEEEYLVVTGGGGGIPVVERPYGFDGVDAVIDKDATSSLLARQLGAEAFVILTDVDRVAIDFGTAKVRFLDRMTTDEADRYAAEGHFGTGSMGPKVEAARAFATACPDGVAIITDACSVRRALAGGAGTRIALAPTA